MIEAVLLFLVNQILFSKLLFEPLLEQRKIINEIEFAIHSARMFYEDDCQKGYLGKFEYDSRAIGKELFLLSVKIRNTLDTFLFYDVLHWLGAVVSKEDLYESAFSLEVLSTDMDTRFDDKLSQEQRKEKKKEFDRRCVDVFDKLNIVRWQMNLVMPRRWGFWGDYPYELRYKKLFRKNCLLDRLDKFW